MRCFALLYVTSLCFIWLRVALFRFGLFRFALLSLRFTLTSRCLDLFRFALLRFTLLYLQVLARSGECWCVFANAGKCLRVLRGVMRSARFASLARGARTTCEEHLRASWECSGSVWRVLGVSCRVVLLRFALLRFVLLGLFNSM